MKIAQVVCTFPPYKGGIGQVAFDYSQAIKDSANKVVVFSPNYGKDKIDYPFEVVNLRPVLKYGNAAFLPQLFFHLWFGKFDIVHLHYPFFGSMEIVFLLKKFFRPKFKLVIHYHMKVIGLPWYLEIARLPARLIEKALFKQADKITCASIDYVKNNNQDVFLANQKKFVEIPFGVNTDFYKPGQQKKKQILFVGGMDKAHYFKGVNILLEAFSRLKIDYKLVLVGKGDLLATYKKHAKDLKIMERTSFLGGVDNEKLRKIYQESSLLVLPSINNCEAFGIVLLEAMSSGTPVIASSLPGVREVFQDKVQGYYAQAGSVIDLEKKINLILSDKEKIREMSQNSRNLAVSKYSLQKRNAKLIDFYKSLL